MTTLLELLRVLDFEPESRDETWFSERYREALIEIRSWAYGQEVECPTCGGSARVLDERDFKDPVRSAPCPDCERGTIREPGLVERLSENPDPRFPIPPSYVWTALREELGEP